MAKIETARNGQRRPTVSPHHGNLTPTMSFNDAYGAAQRNPATVYNTSAGRPYTLHAALAKRGEHKGQRVIRFMRNEKESARAYECCWGHVTNCNRTYIDSYTSSL
ncbi:MAG: hypothetical protein KER_03053 [Kerstersia gyiorum]|uniref:hypothetical protein n=1 Tax=Kerstersia gyiorum TaxID=206506 RepID=UPI0030CF1C11